MSNDNKSNASSRLSALNSQIPELSPSQLLHSYRNRSKVDRQGLYETFYGPKWEFRNKVYDIICNNSEKFSAPYIDEHDRERSRYTAFKELHFIQKSLNMGYAEYQKDPHAFSMTSNAVYSWNPAICVKYGVHFSLYGKTLMNLGTEKHLPYIYRMMKLEDIGSFGLTEMGHGSNVRGIKTTATYDPQTNEFIINTPEEVDMKFWIGATAQLANMTVCWAQLYVEGKCHGVHALLVPIRNKDTHKIMPGITVGDCGPKNGLDGIDNGFMIFHNVRVPYDNLLDKFSQIENGKFKTWIESDDKRFGFQMASLSGGRVQVALNSNQNSIIALTIAGRYSTIRKQFGAPGKPEQSIIEYPLTQYRIIPNIATAVVLQLSTITLSILWDENQKHLLDVKNTLINELHAISSAIKAISTWTAQTIITESRQILGGHGFSTFNRFGQLHNDNDVNVTWEGDNNVLLQQTGKFLLDSAKKLMKGKKLPFKSTSYITLDPAEGQKSEFNSDEDFYNQGKLLKALQWRVNLLLQKTGLKMQEYMQVNKNGWDAFNTAQPFYSVELSKAFGDAWSAEQAIETISKVQNPENKRVLNDFVTLYLLETINKDIGNFRFGGYINCQQHEQIRSSILKLCNKLKDEFISVLDALAPPDFILQAPFGASDGDIYNRYIGLIYSAKSAFKRPDWWKEVHKAHKKYHFEIDA
ncbi:hypothetical protein ABPG72_003943 [Tetrahymena utriculariae]